jgi:hypothetical protein
MADREREDAVESGSGESAEPRPPDEPSEQAYRPPAEAGACPDCAYPRLTLIRDTAVVSVYKCPNCGCLAAPVKKNLEGRR